MFFYVSPFARRKNRSVNLRPELTPEGLFSGYGINLGLKMTPGGVGLAGALGEVWTLVGLAGLGGGVGVDEVDDGEIGDA